MKKYIKDPFPALSHLFGAFLSIAALVTLIQKSGTNERAVIASAIYGASLILLYTASALAHGIHCSPEMSERLDRFDYAAIFVLIAGTYTPVCLLIIRGTFGWGMLSAEWILAFFGIYNVFFRPSWPIGVQVLIYLCMGWLVLFALGPIIAAVPNSFLAWMIAGGLFYSVGAIFFVTNRPVLWEGRFDAHDLWHLFVLGGSACHFIFILLYMGQLSVSA